MWIFKKIWSLTNILIFDQTFDFDQQSQFTLIKFCRELF